MKSNQLLSFLWVMLCLLPLSISAQGEGIVKGIIYDASTSEILEGTRVVWDSTGGTIGGPSGYEMKIPAGEHLLEFSFIGYKKEARQITVQAGETLELNMALTPETKELDIVVVTGSRHEKKLGEEIASMEVVKPYLIENNNALDGGEVVAKVPGVTIVDRQISIRGAGGYSYGVGSRVQVLVDDIPILTGDLAEVRWNFIPIEHVEQVEVIKGSASSLYGSSAMNGVVNFRTGSPGDVPVTKIQISQGIYNNPARQAIQWWPNSTRPFYTNAFMSHRRKLNDKSDITLGGQLSLERGYQEGADDQNGRFNIRYRYHPEKKPGMRLELNSNVMYQRFGQFFLWETYETAYKPFAGTLSQDRYTYANIDPVFTYLTEGGTRHIARGRYYNIARWYDDGRRSASSHIYSTEYQYQKEFNRNITLTAGGLVTFTNSFSNLYPGQKIVTAQGALYAQAEKRFNDKLTVLGGMRYEMNWLSGYELLTTAARDSNGVGRPILRAGLNYRPTKSTYIRASIGEGYRFPSVGERFLDANLGNVLQIIPNTELQPEHGWTAEMGLKQALKVGEWLGFFDFAVFWTEYKDMVEYNFRSYIFDSTGIKIGFQPNNVSKARVAGFECSLMGEGQIGPFPLRFLGGYTFNYPADLASDSTQQSVSVFLGNMMDSFSDITAIDANSILKYSMRHLVRADIEMEWKKLMVGFNYSYNGFMDRIDNVFSIIPGVEQYREVNNSGNAVMNARIAYQINEQSRLNFILKNLANREYALRPALMEAPRSFEIQYKIVF